MGKRAVARQGRPAVFRGERNQSPRRTETLHDRVLRIDKARRPATQQPNRSDPDDPPDEIRRDARGATGMIIDKARALRLVVWAAAAWIAWEFLYYEQFKLTGDQGSIDGVFQPLATWF